MNEEEYELLLKEAKKRNVHNTIVFNKLKAERDELKKKLKIYTDRRIDECERCHGVNLNGRVLGTDEGKTRLVKKCYMCRDIEELEANEAEIKRITNYDGIGCGTTLFEGHYKCRAGSLCPICEKKAEKDGIIDIAVSLIGKACSKHTEMVKKMGFQEFMEKHPPECIWCLKSENEKLVKERYDVYGRGYEHGIAWERAAIRDGVEKRIDELKVGCGCDKPSRFPCEKGHLCFECDGRVNELEEVLAILKGDASGVVLKVYEKDHVGCPICGKSVHKDNDCQKNGKAHCYNCFHGLCNSKNCGNDRVDGSFYCEKHSGTPKEVKKGGGGK